VVEQVAGGVEAEGGGRLLGRGAELVEHVLSPTSWISSSTLPTTIWFLPPSTLFVVPASTTYAVSGGREKARGINNI
jgi:hypothetical protein